jgi:hypothetical protein
LEHDAGCLEPRHSTDPARGKDRGHPQEDEPEDHCHTAGSDDVETPATMPAPIESEPSGDFTRQFFGGKPSGLRPGGISIVGHRHDLRSNTPQPIPPGEKLWDGSTGVNVRRAALKGGPSPFCVD